MKSGWIGLPAAWLSARFRNWVGRKASRGFTLVESLTALAILAIALTALFQNYSGSVNVVRATDDYAEARILAESILDEALVMPGSPPDQDGKLGRFVWRLTSDKLASSAAAKKEGKPIDIYNVEVQVAWPPDRRIGLSTLKLAAQK